MVVVELMMEVVVSCSHGSVVAGFEKEDVDERCGSKSKYQLLV